MNADERLFRFGEYDKKLQGGKGKGSKNQNGNLKWHLPLGVYVCVISILALSNKYWGTLYFEGEQAGNLPD